jgi:branched-chain amino acid transport system permease protein
VAGLLWGSRQGVQFALTLVGLKSLPVLIIGGFTSITGAIVGGLIVGAGDSLAEIYLGALLGGSVSSWFAYALAVVFLLVRPAGLFGERPIERI